MRNILKWDKDSSKQTKIFREMLFSDPKKVLKKYEKESLRKVFFDYYFKFDKRNMEFWRIILDIDEKEIEKISTESFRKDCRIWDY